MGKEKGMPFQRNKSKKLIRECIGMYPYDALKITKRGSASLRKTGYEIMQALKVVRPQNDNAVYQYLIKKENESKPLKVAKIEALNKFLRIYDSRVKEVYSNS